MKDTVQAMTDSVQDQVIAIIAQQAVLDRADVPLDASLSDLGLDSLGLVETIFAIEETFDVTVPFNANDPAASGVDLSSVAAVVAAVQALVAAG
jgi:acyl carrier protein